jgi:hypothetical protein
LPPWLAILRGLNAQARAAFQAAMTGRRVPAPYSHARPI